MKLTKQIKSKLAVMLDKALNWYFLNNPDNEKFIAKIIDKIEIILNDKQPRSLPEHRLYFKMCEWLAGAMPEYIHRLLDIGTFNTDIVHELLKAKFKITSTAFNALSEVEFNQYFKNCQHWVATYLLKCKVEDIDEMVKSS